ncbi:AraC family transcriptional regulator [Variovorax sp. RA8]|uniref:AraC family transcriptional regulator n=1 Tax=Variovorax sp. (strain JCM 16519 / RA8) TaxID=662548 RepID=UPI003FCEB257
MGETIHVEELADAVHLSPFHFARMFKQSTGQSPHLHILLQRIASSGSSRCTSRAARSHFPVTAKAMSPSTVSASAPGTTICTRGQCWGASTRGRGSRFAIWRAGAEAEVLRPALPHDLAGSCSSTCPS